MDYIARAFGSVNVGREAIVLAFGVLTLSLAWSVLATFWSPDLALALVPGNVSAAFGTLWQAQTAIVGLSIPLLILLVEQGGGNAILATSRGPALIRESRILFTSVLSLGSVLVIGVAATYFDSPSSLFASMTLSGLCVFLIGQGYVRALRLILSPTRLRESSVQLFLSRVESSVDESFLAAEANNVLAGKLAHLSPEPMSMKRLWNDVGWVVVPSESSGFVADMNVDGLARVLAKAVDTQQVGRVFGDAADARVDPLPSSKSLLMLARRGDQVREGQPLLAYKGRPGYVSDLRRCTRVDR